MPCVGGPRDEAKGDGGSVEGVGIGEESGRDKMELISPGGVPHGKQKKKNKQDFLGRGGD